MTTTTVRPVPSLLRLALRLDAVVTAANGAAYLLAAPLLGDLLGLPAGWLRGVGVFLLLFGAVVWAVARPARAARRRHRRGGQRAVGRRQRRHRGDRRGRP